MTELYRALGVPSRARGGGKLQEQQVGAIIVVATAVAVVFSSSSSSARSSGPRIDPPDVAVVFSLVALRVSQSEAFLQSPRSSVAASSSLTAPPSASAINSAAYASASVTTILRLLYCIHHPGRTSACRVIADVAGAKSQTSIVPLPANRMVAT